MYNCETNLRACQWVSQPIQDDIVSLSALSIGGTSCLEDAGSFGGFLVDDNGDLHGMTARHCVPGMRDGDSVSSPSSLEVTARFQYIVNYTRYQPEKFVRRMAKDREAEQILNRYRVVDRAGGVECNIDGNPRGGTLADFANSASQHSKECCDAEEGMAVTLPFGKYL